MLTSRCLVINPLLILQRRNDYKDRESRLMLIYSTEESRQKRLKMIFRLNFCFALISELEILLRIGRFRAGCSSVCFKSEKFVLCSKEKLSDSLSEIVIKMTCRCRDDDYPQILHYIHHSCYFLSRTYLHIKPPNICERRELLPGCKIN